jgi:hypothetical protein
MLDIVKWGLKDIVYFPHHPIDQKSSLIHTSPDIEKAEMIARLGRLNLRPYKGNLNWLRDHIQNLKRQGVFSTPLP